MPKSMARNIDNPMYNSNGTVVDVLGVDDDDCSPRRLPHNSSIFATSVKMTYSLVEYYYHSILYDIM